MYNSERGKQDNKGNVAIIGGGLAGSMMALQLAQNGYSVDVFERRCDPRTSDNQSGRSINLGLSKRGIQALKSVNLLDKVMASAVEMRGRVIHSLDGSLGYQPYGKDEGEVLHSIDRNELNRLLLETADEIEGVNLHFGHKLVEIDKASRKLIFNTENETINVFPERVIGADGAFSETRKELQRGERADYQQEFLEWGYKELTLTANLDNTSKIESCALHVWPRDHNLMVSHPNRDGSHTLTLFLPHVGDVSFASLDTKEVINSFLTTYFPDLIDSIPELSSQWIDRETGSLITTKTSQWCFDEWAVLIGDACHAQYPFYGQGMNSAFEDCCLLISILKAHEDDTALAFHLFEVTRKPHTDVLAELSKLNFIELRRKVKSPWFVARKNLDTFINRMFPKIWLPLYYMISHTSMPYGDALARSKLQNRILNTSASFIVIGFVIWVLAIFWSK
jgi:kynurenine 3-monooxygenase